jgi:hypothetical protein
MVNELAPILVKLLLIEPFIASIAEEMPTKAVIPKKIISIVKNALSLLALMESVAIFIFSDSNNDIVKNMHN